jgi:hypothetical protein
MKEQEMIKLPNLKIEETIKNTVKWAGYSSFEERVFDLSQMIKSSIDAEYTKIIGSNTYVGLAKDYKSQEPRKHHPVFNGVYKLAPITEYIGFIPERNQTEINDRFKSLIENPFLKQKFELVILAPLNNFAQENNITAIDPIAFAYFKDGENCCEKNYLITLSQWV